MENEGFIFTKEDLRRDIDNLKQFYSKEIIEYLNSLLSLEVTGLEEEKVRKFLSERKDFFKYFNYNFWYRTKKLVDDMDNSKVKFEDGSVVVKRNHVANMFLKGYYNPETFENYRRKYVDITEPLEVTIRTFDGELTLDELKLRRKALLEELHEFEQRIFERRNESVTNNYPSVFGNKIKKEREEITSRLDVIDRKIYYRTIHGELFHEPIYMDVANKLLESFDLQDESKFTDEKGLLVKKQPHLIVRKIKY